MGNRPSAENNLVSDAAAEIGTPLYVGALPGISAGKDLNSPDVARRGLLADAASNLPVWFRLCRLSPLRTDSRQLVSKIYWWQSAKNGIMREPEWREPTGFVWFAPAGGGNVWVDVNRRIIQNYPHGRGFYVTEFACLVPALPA